MNLPVAASVLDPALWPGLQWEVLRPGVDVHWIHSTPKNEQSAALLRYAPGAYVPTHEHAGSEHILVLQGSQEDDNGRYPAGTLVFNPTGTRHDVRSPEGCVVLAVWERPVRFV